MRFHSAMASMASNHNHTQQFAERIGWDKARAEAALLAYATGAFFPSHEELRAMGAGDSLLWAYKLAVNAYHVNKILEAGGGPRLYELLQKATVDKWRVGNAMPSGRSKTKIEAEFGVSLEEVPPECIFQYVPSNDKIRLDLRRNLMWLDNFRVALVPISETSYAVSLDAMQQGFVDAARNADLIFIDRGDFMRAEPASKVYIYYAKT